MLIKSALVARGTFVVCEYDASPGNEDLLEVSRKVLSKIPRTGAIRSYVYSGYTFNYLLDKDMIFLCIAAVSAGSELAFQFLNDFRRSFEKLQRTGGAEREAKLTRMLRDLMAEYNSDSRTTKVQQMEQELEDVTEIMRDNLGKVMQRGEKIESLIDKTNSLKFESNSFRDSAKRHNDALWWREQRGRIILGTCALLVVTMTLYHIFKAHSAAVSTASLRGA